MTDIGEKTPLRAAIDKFCDNAYPEDEIVLFGEAGGDCYDEGFLGVAQRMNQVPVAVYDRALCINALAKELAADYNQYSDFGDADPYTDAVEYWYFNSEGSWIGEQTPIIITRFP